MPTISTCHNPVHCFVSAEDQGLVEQFTSVVHAEHLRPALERTVAGDLVMFDGLRSRYESGIKRGHALELLQDFFAFLDDAVDRRAGLALVRACRGFRTPPAGVRSSKGSPAEFDAADIDAQVTAHEEALSSMESYAQNGENQALKTHAQKTASVIQQHLEHTQHFDFQHLILNAPVDSRSSIANSER